MQIQSGVFTFDQSVYPQLRDNDPAGERMAQDFISFPIPFDTTPTVVASISRLDGANTSNLRILVSTDTVNNTGFELLATTWADTQIWSVGVSWIAYTN